MPVRYINFKASSGDRETVEEVEYNNPDDWDEAERCVREYNANNNKGGHYYLSSRPCKEK